MKSRDEKIKYYTEKSQEFFPGIYTSEVRSWFNPELQSEPTSGKIEFSGRFLNEATLVNGPVQFIHYTSIPSAMNILNSGKIRLYNCLNLNDPSEIKYLLDKSPIDFSEDEIEKYKHDHFILSGSLYESENDEDFSLWRLYGDNGRGVALVFEINENVKNWMNIYLQKVSYEGAQNSSGVNEYLNFHKAFNDKYKLFENKPDFFSLLATGVKKEIWSVEKEFRIVVKNINPQSYKGYKNNPLISKSLNYELKPSGKFVSYVELPLNLNDYQSNKIESPITNKEVDSIDYVPNLKVKKVIFGPNNPLEKDEGYIYFIKNLSEHYGSGIALSKSTIDL